LAGILPQLARLLAKYWSRWDKFEFLPIHQYRWLATA